MKISYMFSLLFMFMSASCSAAPKTIIGTVVDAETGKPIEGAVVLVEWTRSHGIGNTYMTSDKIVELLTDKEGKFTVSGVFNSANTHLTIYKKGHIAWNNEFAFPGYKKRMDFTWEKTDTFRLVRFDEQIYTHEDHTFFIHGVTKSSLGDKKLISDAYRWEELRASEERDEAWRKKMKTSK